MKSSQEILHELLTISPLLAGMEKANVFDVPHGYFDGLHLRIAQFATLDNPEQIDSLNKIGLQEVPEGYFDTLSDLILSKVKAAYPESAGEELRNLSSVLYDLKEKNVFSVPQGYFDNLETIILSNVKAGNSESAEEELRNLSIILYNLKDKNVFSVPEKYFDSLSENIRNRTLLPQARIVHIKRKITWWKYAAAAIVTGIITVFSFQLFTGSNHSKNGNSGNAEYAALPDYVKASLQYKNEEDLNAGLAQLSDADIIKYLEKNGNIMDNELLTNNADESEMPSQSDYLNDANTLNNYLDKIDAQKAINVTP